jgi:hypothetical protein
MTQYTEPYIKPFMKIWFWLLILSIAGFIIYAVFFEQQKNNFDGSNIPSWTWIMIILSIFFLIVSFVLYRLDIAAYNKRKALAIACGDIPIEPPKPALQCPKKEPIQKIVCKQTKPLPCANSNTEQHIYYKNPHHQHHPQHQHQHPVQVSQFPSSPINVELNQPSPLNISQVPPSPLNVSQVTLPPLNISQVPPSPLNIAPNQPSPLNIAPNQPSPLNIAPNQPSTLNIAPNQPSSLNIAPNQPSPLNILSKSDDNENFIPPGRG